MKERKTARFISVLAVAILLCVGSNYIQGKGGAGKNKAEKDDYLILTGEVKKLEVETLSTPEPDANLTVHLILKFYNNSKTNLLLLKTPPMVRPLPMLISSVLFKNDEDTENNTLLHDSMGESVNGSRYWEEFKKSLDIKSPPLSSFIILQPKESYQIEAPIGLYFPNSSNGGYLPASVPTWERFKKLPYVNLIVYYSLWSDNLEVENGKVNSKLKFAGKLRKRLKKQGRLISDGVKSEPIKINLKAYNLN